MPQFRFAPLCLLFGALVAMPVSAQTDPKSLSYGVGVLLGNSLKRQGFEGLVADELARGVADVLGGGETRVTSKEASNMVQQYLQEKKAAEIQQRVGEGKAFLARNGQRAEVTTLPSGLQYEVLSEGKGARPGKDDQVTVHYTGTLIDGTVFDSSVQRGSPATFGVSQVIAGWTEALQLMPEGSKWKLYIPQDLAYGERGAGEKIPAFSTLVFEVELLKVN